MKTIRQSDMIDTAISVKYDKQDIYYGEKGFPHISRKQINGEPPDAILHYSIQYDLEFSSPNRLVDEGEVFQIEGCDGVVFFAREVEFKNGLNTVKAVGQKQIKQVETMS